MIHLKEIKNGCVVLRK